MRSEPLSPACPAPEDPLCQGTVCLSARVPELLRPAVGGQHRVAGGAPAGSPQTDRQTAGRPLERLFVSRSLVVLFSVVAVVLNVFLKTGILKMSGKVVFTRVSQSPQPQGGSEGVTHLRHHAGRSLVGVAGASEED